jgi:hypothetical protein
MKCEHKKYTHVTMNILNVSENTEIERIRMQDIYKSALVGLCWRYLHF